MVRKHEQRHSWRNRQKEEIRLRLSHLNLQVSPQSECAWCFLEVHKRFDNINAKIRKELQLVCRRRNRDLHLEGDVAQLTEKDYEG